MLVTWNVHGNAGDLPRLLADLKRGRVHDGAIDDFVLLLQETGPDVLEVARREGLSAYFELVHPSRGNAILSTRPLINARTIELPRERQRRVAVAATILLDNLRLRIASTHFENRVSWWRGGGLFSEGARLRQADALIAALPPGEPAVVGGDFNAWLGRSEPAWRALAARFPDGPAPLPRPSFRERLFLDELFFDLPEGWRADRMIVDNQYGSDHHAVVGTIRSPR